MQWTDEALILDVGKYAEHAAIVHVFTCEHGRYSGLSKAALSSKQRAIYQPGNLVQAVWKARLSEHMGTIDCELVQSLGALSMQDALRLAAIQSVCALLKTCMAERDAHTALYNVVRMLCVRIAHDEMLAWLTAYALFEKLLLQECGAGLDVSECAASGSRDDLCYVSPKSGCAVSRIAGEPYKDRLLTLPPFFRDDSLPATASDITDALALTGYFLEHRWAQGHHQQIPMIRSRFTTLLQKHVIASSVT